MNTQSFFAAPCSLLVRRSVAERPACAWMGRRSFLSVLAVASLALFGSGCAIFKDGPTQNQVTAAFEGAARLSTSEYVLARPQARPVFVVVASQCEALSMLPEPTPAQLYAILVKLPIKELKGSGARIAFGTADIAFMLFVAGRSEIEVFPAIKEFSAAIARGIRTGLE